MDDIKALSIVSALANGVHLYTGEVFDMDSPYQSPDVIRALYIAMRALETTTRAASGSSWSCPSGLPSRTRASRLAPALVPSPSIDIPPQRVPPGSRRAIP